MFTLKLFVEENCIISLITCTVHGHGYQYGVLNLQKVFKTQTSFKLKKIKKYNHRLFIKLLTQF